MCLYLLLYLAFPICFFASAVDPLSHSLCLSLLLSRTDEVIYSYFSPRRILIRQGHSCVWIMSELRSKYLFMTSCLDWCSCAIWFFMYHGLDWLAASLAREGFACQCPWNTEKQKRLSGLAQKSKMPPWLWVVLMKCLTEVIHLICCRVFKKKVHLGMWINFGYKLLGD